MDNQTSALRPLDHLLVVPDPKMTYLSNAPLRFATSVTKSALYRINDFINCVNRLNAKKLFGCNIVKLKDLQLSFK